MNAKVRDLLNQQINKEFYSAYLYLEFSNYFDFYVMDSFNHGIPCIVGNNVIFFKGG